MAVNNWLTGGLDWLPLLNGAEDTYGIPRNLLARMAFQECSWRPEVINCTVKSPAGAVGMMQLMPKYFPNAGVSIANDIHLAAGLLAALHARFGDWQLAVAAYNWGGGNVHHEMAADGVPELADMPLETQRYVKDVFADVPIAGVLVDTPVDSAPASALV